MRFTKFLFLILPFVTACDEIQMPLEGPEIVVIGNGMELASSGVSDQLLADVANEGRMTSLIVTDGSAKPAIQNTETGKALEVTVTDAVHKENGNEIIRISNPSEDLGGCEIFERQKEGQLVCRTDLQEMPLDQESLPLMFGAEEESKAIFMSEANELRYGDAENSICITEKPNEYFVNEDRVFFRHESSWAWYKIEEVQEEEVEEVKDCLFSNPIDFKADYLVPIAGGVFAFNWKADSKNEKPLGFFPVDLENRTLGKPLWLFSEKTENLDFQGLPLSLKDGSVLGKLSYFEDFKMVQQIIHLHPFLNREESVVMDLNHWDFKASVGRKRLLIETQDSLENCALVPMTEKWSWQCQPLMLDFERRIESVALDKQDHLVIALAGEKNELWTLSMEDLSILGQQILEGRFSGFRMLSAGAIKKYSQTQSSHSGPEEKFQTSDKVPEK